MADSISLCPVLYPSAKQFSNFNEYMQKLDRQYSKTHGMVKIVPPQGYKARVSGYDKSIQNVMIPGPIEQNLYGKGGIYESLLIQKKSLLMKDYRQKSESFDYITQGLSMEEAQDLFWKNISFSPPLYGADVYNTLFDDNAKWNLNNITSLLTDGIENKISGVNTPYLYVGAWQTLFAWHKEDLDLPAINYLHYGKTKFWYAIESQDGAKLEAMAQQHFSDSFAQCPEFMRHQTIVMNPYLVQQRFPDIQINQIPQNAGEFIIVFSGAYHSGFNHGFNIAEAVNYATLSWLGKVLNTKHCKCTSDNVQINAAELLENLLLKPQYAKLPEILALKKELELIKQEANQILPQNNGVHTQAPIQPHQKKDIEYIEEKKEGDGHQPIKTQNSQQINQKTTSKLEQHQQIREQLLKKKAAASNLASPSQLIKTKATPTQSKSKERQETKQNNDIQPLDIGLIEQWFCCDTCNQWRKIVDNQTAKAIEKRPQFFCENIVGLNCQKPQENSQDVIVLSGMGNGSRRSQRVKK